MFWVGLLITEIATLVAITVCLRRAKKHPSEAADRHAGTPIQPTVPKIFEEKPLTPQPLPKADSYEIQNKTRLPKSEPASVEPPQRLKPPTNLRPDQKAPTVNGPPPNQPATEHQPYSPKYDNWVGTGENRYPPDWEDRSKRVRKKDEGRCQVTGCYSKGTLHVHHIKPITKGGRHELENLVTLCQFHHYRMHEGNEALGNADDGRFTFVQGGIYTSAHIRRVVLASAENLISIRNYYGLKCRNCGNANWTGSLRPRDKLAKVLCSACGVRREIKHRLAEEMGEELARILTPTQNEGRFDPSAAEIVEVCDGEDGKNPPEVGEF